MKKKLLLILLSHVLLINLVAQNYNAAVVQADKDRVSLGYHYDKKRNVYYSNDGVIHIFIYQDGNLLLTGYPTTATEKDKFQVHLYVNSDNKKRYVLDYTGNYTPTLNIENANLLITRAEDPVTIQTLVFAKLGPFTNTLILTLKEEVDDKSFKTLTTSSVQIAKTIHASIGSGFIYTTLKNPDNIKHVPLSGTDSTLLADDVTGRGMLTIMATFYPWGRNNLFLNSKKFEDHFGIVAGTTIGSGTSNFKNFFLGAQYDFTVGGSLVLGLHYGKRQKIAGVNYNDFEFGKDKFTGNLADKTYMRWDAGIFFGIQIDSRIFSLIFK